MVWYVTLHGPGGRIGMGTVLCCARFTSTVVFLDHCHQVLEGILLLRAWQALPLAGEAVEK